MRRSVQLGLVPFAALLLFLTNTAVRAASENTDDHGSVQIVVTVESKHHGQPAPKLEKDDIAVTQGGHKAKVLSWLPLKGDDAPVQLFVVLDDSSRMNAVGTHIGELQQLLTSLPPSVSTAVGYMANRRVLVASPFTTDHAAASKSVRLPNGSAGSNASPYFALSELAKHWPDPASNARRVVLWLTDGVDPYDTSSDLSQDIYMQAAIADAQRADIQVYSIFLAGKGPADRSIYGVNQGQSKLSIVSEQTGGHAYNEGFTNPVSLLPYLDDFEQQLDNQYRLVFESTSDIPKAALENVHVKTEIAGVDLISASKVYVSPR